MIVTVTQLSLRNLKVWNTRWGCLRQLPLQHLDLSYCEFSDEELKHLRLLPLTHLSFGWNDISDAGLAHLRPLPLQHLALNNCVNLTDAGLYTYGNYRCSTWTCTAATN